MIWKQIRIQWNIFFYISLFTFFIHCYSFTGSSLPAHINTIAIPLFDDQTSEFGINEKVTDAVIEEITRDNSLKIAGEDIADAIVIGNVINVTDQAFTYDQREDVQAFRVYISVNIEVKDVKKETLMWNERLRQWGEYSLDDPEEGTREEAINEAIQKIAEDILNKTVSGW